jgi:hypothetical protein
MPSPPVAAREAGDDDGPARRRPAVGRHRGGAGGERRPQPGTRAQHPDHHRGAERDEQEVEPERARAGNPVAGGAAEERSRQPRQEGRDPRAEDIAGVVLAGLVCAHREQPVAVAEDVEAAVRRRRRSGAEPGPERRAVKQVARIEEDDGRHAQPEAGPVGERADRRHLRRPRVDRDAHQQRVGDREPGGEREQAEGDTVDQDADGERLGGHEAAADAVARESDPRRPRAGAGGSRHLVYSGAHADARLAAAFIAVPTPGKMFAGRDGFRAAAAFKDRPGPRRRGRPGSEIRSRMPC